MMRAESVEAACSMLCYICGHVFIESLLLKQVPKEFVEKLKGDLRAVLFTGKEKVAKRIKEETKEGPVDITWMKCGGGGGGR